METSLKTSKVLKDVKLLILDKPAPSGKIYPSEVVALAIKDSKYHTGILRESMGSLQKHLENGISLSEASHVVSDLRINEGYLTGDIKILNNENGKIVSDFITEPFDNLTSEYKFSLLGVTNLHRNNNVIIVNTLKIHSFIFGQ